MKQPSTIKIDVHMDVCVCVCVCVCVYENKDDSTYKGSVV